MRLFSDRLLGTGPIVDPELKANLLIPLHNFSSQDVTLHYGDQIISVEFTKTLNPDDQLNSGQEKNFKYVNNKSRIFDFEKYRKRIGGKRVESSVSSKFDEYDETIEGYKNRLRMVSWIGGITLLSAIIGLGIFYYTTWLVVDSAKSQVYEAYQIIKQHQGENVDLNSFVLKSTFDDLKRQFLELKKYIEQLNAESHLKSSKSAVDLNEVLEKCEKNIKAIELKINEMNRKVENQADIEASKQ